MDALAGASGVAKHVAGKLLTKKRLTSMPHPGNDRNPALPFDWTRKPRSAVELLAQSQLGVTQVAEAVGISLTRLAQWRAHPEFKAREDHLRQQHFANLRLFGLAVRENRMLACMEQLAKIEAIIASRQAVCQAMPADQRVPGEETGMLIIGGKDGKRKGRYDFNLSRDKSHWLEVLAREAGHRDNKKLDITSGGKPLPGGKVYIITKEADDKALEVKRLRMEGNLN